MKSFKIFCTFLLLILCHEGRTQTPLTLRDKGYCGSPDHQLNDENISKLVLRTKGLTDPGRHYLAKKYSIGESATFYSFNFVSEQYQQITATLRGSLDNINIWVEDAEWNNFHVMNSDVQNILNGLLLATPAGSVSPNQGIIGIIHEYFGLPPNYDGDGITDFLITDIHDGYTEGEAFIAGYFNPIDQYQNGTRVGTTYISGSNERDILYIDSNPGIFGQSGDPYQQVLATVSHEYQHLIQYRYDRNEDTWVNEGLSELSSFLCGYELRNPSDYLLDTSIGLAAWDNSLGQALKHYAKVALWTYYLYEKFGDTLIKDLAQTSSSGINGINDALQQQGLTLTFPNVLPSFFTAITLNDVSVHDMYGFDYIRLNDLSALPLKTVTDYPFSTSRSQQPYSLNMYSLENGDSLDVQFAALPENDQIFVLKQGTNGETVRTELSGMEFSDPGFGSLWNREKLMIINNGGSASVSSFNIISKPKYFVGSLDYSTDSTADLNIITTGSIPANQFQAPYDSCILKSVSFNTLQTTGAVRVHVYLQQLQEGNYPEEVTIELANVLESNWTTIDLENLQIRRNEGETFDVGIEFLEYGVLGYARTPSGLDRSFLKRSSDATFNLLSSFKINSETLNGIWMIKMEYNAPLHNKPPQNDGKVPYTINLIGPTPFPTPGNPAMRIGYTLDRTGRVRIEIFNILGELVKTVFNGYEQGLTSMHWWDGTNNRQNRVASGQYFLCFSFERYSEMRKILVLR